jgi:tetratricopeptide (TPR) repeat protein
MKAYFPGVIVLSLLTAGGIMPVARADNLEHTQQLITTKDCPRCDLNKAGLVYADLVGANLSEANLIQANLSHADLASANLQGAQLNGAILFGADLSGADLSGANLQGVDLRGANLTNANLQNAVIDGANLLGAVGMPAEIATVDNYYRWGMEEAERENFRGAVNYYNQALSMEPDFAHAYLARSIARFRLGEHMGALEDAQQADQLYLEQNNERGHLVASQFSQSILTAQELYERRQRGGRSGGAGGNILNVLGGLAGMAFQVLKYMSF